MKILVKSAWGSDDPTKSAFAFLHANALAEAGHEAQIFLLGEAVSLMRDPVANAIVPVGCHRWRKPCAQPRPSAYQFTSEVLVQGLGESLTRISWGRRRRLPTQQFSSGSLNGRTSCSPNDGGASRSQRTNQVAGPRFAWLAPARAFRGQQVSAMRTLRSDRIELRRLDGGMPRSWSHCTRVRRSLEPFSGSSRRSPSRKRASSARHRRGAPNERLERPDVSVAPQPDRWTFGAQTSRAAVTGLRSKWERVLGPGTWVRPG
jgi:predicted peroxiredoxin